MSELKTCSKCNIPKSLDQFTKSKYNKDGLMTSCKLCKSLYAKEYRTLNPEKIKAKKQLDNITRYGITSTQYTNILEKQNGVCAICSGPATESRLAIDHDHSCCGKDRSCGECIRGLLCGRCNRGLGSFKDNIELLKRATEYLNRFNSEVI